ncbi:ImpA family metalloprotease [Rhodoferax aquaticus]|uniref:Peptidase M60 domain-containing protein n=1 Tax=Rhodoferax aquaticus TaxID=2527691 RepID=A0A515ESA6_9BURK|nr:ImpA family metalloprotease [Rhodoferax aquaticus]QDL55540.1 hypothetical protein EXZ61_15905 [Rhodoferax aquaticus]
MRLQIARKRLSARHLFGWATLALVALLTACGGGKSGNTPSSISGSSPVTLVAAPQPSSPIALALATGDSSALTDAKLVAQHAQYAQQQISLAQAARISSLYQGVSTEYDPSRWSYWVQPRNTATAQPLIVGDQGNTLASMSVAAGGRSAGFGVQVLERFNGNELVAYRPAFKRLLAWLVRGDAAGTLPATLNVAFAGINATSSAAGLVKAGVPVTTIACDFIATPACASNAHLLVVGGDLAASASLETSIRALIAAGRPVLYAHTKSNWTSDSAIQVLAGMGLQFGPYPGNNWASDKVAAGRSEASNRTLSDQFAKTTPILNLIASDSFSMPYDWSPCTVYAGKTDCPGSVTDLQAGLLSPVDALRSQIDVFNRAGQSIFATADTDVLRYLVLWADVVRRQIRYPMDKTGSPAAFQKALIADALVSYVRTTAPAQSDLGTFASALTTGMAVSRADEIVDVTVPATQGFTAIGRLAAPGKPFTVEVLSAGSATVKLRINTHRTGSTRLWEANKYNRPRFLASPEMSLTTGQPLQLVTPYGGTLQLVFSNATPQQNVQLRLRGVAKHPFLDLSNDRGDKAGFVAALNAAQHEWAEIKLPGIEVHSRADMMRAAINTAVYAGDMDKYLSELQELLFEDTYLFAGFVVPGKTLTPHVQAMCVTFGWNCTDPKIHQKPGTQHINVDVYAACGGACSGNPYDQTVGLNPRGGGEGHEIGHNLQKGMHKVYDDRSTEVSNNLFPLHKAWRLFIEQNYNTVGVQVAYQSAFNMIKAAKTEADPIEGAYQRIWGDAAYAAQGAERIAFYLQWVHYWTQRQASNASGWDIVTLLYLHQRQFDAVAAADWAANRNKLGYSTYANKPSPSGNDNMLITLSWITGRDQRPTFDLWGVRYSPEAAAQVAAFGFAAEPALFYANTSVNNHSTVRKVDMSVASPVWPF